MKLSNLLPKPLRRRILKVHQRYVFNKALSRLDVLLNESASSQDINKLLQELIYGWGNQGWSAQTDYLKSCVLYAKKTKSAVLECGSGLTTIVVGYIANKRGIPLFALENNIEWSKRVLGFTQRLNLDNVKLIVNPLKDYGQFGWYDTADEALPETFGMVICDGPPGSTKGGRYGLLPVMNSKLVSGTIVLADDTSRLEEKNIIKAWGEIRNMRADFLGTKHTHAVVVIQ